jgi:hypothetical protein
MIISVIASIHSHTDKFIAFWTLPACGKSGRVRSYRPNKSQKNFKWSFLVAHEHLQGYWGKKTKIRKVRRCYLNTEDQKNAVKKELGMI